MSHKQSFLDLLINISDEHPDLITHKDIQEEVDTFLFEGHDTTSLSMTVTFLLLGMYPDVQVRHVSYPARFVRYRTTSHGGIILRRGPGTSYATFSATIRIEMRR